MNLFDTVTWQAVGLTLQLAGVTTGVLLCIATPLAWWLAQGHSPWRKVVEVFTTLPLVLPPTVLGFYLLMLMGPDGWLGHITQRMGLGLLNFSFGGMLAGAVIASLPFAVLPIRNAFEAVGKRPMEVAACLGAKPLDAFFSVALPQAMPGVASAAVLTATHTLGEFGVMLMVGGNIPGQTRTVSTHIFGHVEALEFEQAHVLSAALVLFSLLALLLLSQLQNRLRTANA